MMTLETENQIAVTSRRLRALLAWLTNEAQKADPNVFAIADLWNLVRINVLGLSDAEIAKLATQVSVKGR